MSHTATDIITCRSCGWQQDFTFWKCLNVTFDPGRKRDLLSGDLTRFVCDKCGWSREVVFPMLYHDMQKQLMLYLVPPGHDINSSTFPLWRCMGEYRFRRVTTLSELVEKIVIFDAGLEDRVVECFKYMLCVELFTQNKPIPEDLFFLAITESDSGEPVMIFEFSNEEELGYELPFESFRKLEAMVRPQLPTIEADSHHWLEVDPAYAKSIFQQVLPHQS